MWQTKPYDYSEYGENSYYGSGKHQESRRRVECPNRLRPFIEEPKVKTLSPGVFTAHSIGGPEITNPTHGMSGWKNGTLFIYNTVWSRSIGWVPLAAYQAAKNQDKFQKAQIAERRRTPFIQQFRESHYY